jgi:peptidoglycan/LPS O-acetylase OafA/YrhL
LKAALFVRNYLPGGVASWHWEIEHFWSLCVEEHFYLLWPSLFVLLGLRLARLIAPLLAVVFAAWRNADWHYNIAAQLLHAPTLIHNGGRSDYCASCLLWGCALSLALYAPGSSRIFWNRKITAALGWCAAIALCAVFVGGETRGASDNL